jgi:hypothetical protein
VQLLCPILARPHFFSWGCWIQWVM